MTGREKRQAMLDLVEDHLLGESERTTEELLDALAFVRSPAGARDAPPWWAEYIYERRSRHREDREDA